MALETTLIPALALGVAGFSVWWQGKLLREERTWQQLAELYVDLLIHEQGFMNPDPELTADPLLREALGPPDHEAWKTKELLIARADAFASPKVMKLWLDSCRKISDLSFFAGEMRDPRDFTPDNHAELAPLVAARDAAGDALRKEIRSDLKTERRWRAGR